MKYYYRSHLIRTSNRDYEYAVIIEYDDGQITVCGCHGDYQNACKRKAKMEKHCLRYIEWIKKTNEIDPAKKAEYINSFENRLNNFKIVKIEAR